uniref:Uncharacterized protein n=1 Tax=Cynoglossus semilaevis TaxID=244447 RepID=A0A3P8WZV3_CYNSE
LHSVVIEGAGDGEAVEPLHGTNSLSVESLHDLTVNVGEYLNYNDETYYLISCYTSYLSSRGAVVESPIDDDEDVALFKETIHPSLPSFLSPSLPCPHFLKGD